MLVILSSYTLKSWSQVRSVTVTSKTPFSSRGVNIFDHLIMTTHTVFLNNPGAVGSNTDAVRYPCYIHGPSIFDSCVSFEPYLLKVIILRAVTIITPSFPGVGGMRPTLVHGQHGVT